MLLEQTRSSRLASKGTTMCLHLVHLKRSSQHDLDLEMPARKLTSPEQTFLVIVRKNFKSICKLSAIHIGLVSF